MSNKFKENLRLNKYISNSGFCSRRKADEYILNNLVLINGKVINDFSFIVSEFDNVIVNGVKIIPNKKKYYVLNKPKNYICTVSDEKNRNTVVDILPQELKSGIHPVGRLDRNTTGVLVLTNDGELTFKLTHPAFNVSKIYKAYIDKPINTKDIKLLKEGIHLEEKLEKFDEIYIVENSNKLSLIVEIHSGKNHFIKKMFEKLNYRVKSLDRLSFSGLTYEGLKRGEYRALSPKEVNFLKKL